MAQKDRFYSWHRRIRCIHSLQRRKTPPFFLNFPLTQNGLVSLNLKVAFLFRIYAPIHAKSPRARRNAAIICSISGRRGQSGRQLVWLCCTPRPAAETCICLKFSPMFVLSLSRQIFGFQHKMAQRPRLLTWVNVQKPRHAVHTTTIGFFCCPAVITQAREPSEGLLQKTAAFLTQLFLGYH
jgi:hypothetical protein